MVVLRGSSRRGDWYANLLVVERRPLLLCVAERSLLTVIVPLTPKRTLIPRWRAAVERRLLAIGVAPAPAQVAGELAAMAHVSVIAALHGATRGAGPAHNAGTGGATPETPGTAGGVLQVRAASSCRGRHLAAALAADASLRGRGGKPCRRGPGRCHSPTALSVPGACSLSRWRVAAGLVCSFRALYALENAPSRRVRREACSVPRARVSVTAAVGPKNSRTHEPPSGGNRTGAHQHRATGIGLGPPRAHHRPRP